MNIFEKQQKWLSVSVNDTKLVSQMCILCLSIEMTHIDTEERDSWTCSLLNAIDASYIWQQTIPLYLSSLLNKRFYHYIHQIVSYKLFH